MGRLENDPFLNELHRLFEKKKNAGSVFITMKRTNFHNRRFKKPAPQDAVSACLVKVTDGKKKISTVVSVKDHARFMDAYSTILKANMDALKRKEKVKDKKPAVAPKAKQ